MRTYICYITNCTNDVAAPRTECGECKQWQERNMQHINTPMTTDIQALHAAIMRSEYTLAVQEGRIEQATEIAREAALYGVAMPSTTPTTNA